MSNPNPALYGIYFGLGGSDFDVEFANQEAQERAVFTLVRSLEAAAFFKGAASMKRRAADEAFRLKREADGAEKIERAIRELPIQESPSAWQYRCQSCGANLAEVVVDGVKLPRVERCDDCTGEGK